MKPTMTLKRKRKSGKQPAKPEETCYSKAGKVLSSVVGVRKPQLKKLKSAAMGIRG